MKYIELLEAPINDLEIIGNFNDNNSSWGKINIFYIFNYFYNFHINIYNK